MTAEVFHAPMSWLNAAAFYVCVAGAERERIGGEREVKGREKEREREKRKEMREEREKRKEMRDERRERYWYSERENEYTVL